MMEYNDNDFQQSIKLNFWPVSRPCQQLKHKNLQSRDQMFKACFDMRVTIFINFINQDASKMKYWLMSMICLTVDEKENNNNQNLVYGEQIVHSKEMAGHQKLWLLIVFFNLH